MSRETEILITGAKGQLGNEIKDISGSYDLKFLFTDIEELDLTNKKDLDLFLSENNVDFIINCSAFTAVDDAESNEDEARLINKDAVRNLVDCSEKYSIKLIHISTDYVFDGKSFIPYKEDHPTNPQTIYGKTKLEGEQEILNSDIQALIIRTSWLYSAYGKNFVKTILRLGNERPDLSVVYDQKGTPTYAGDLGKAILEIVSQCIVNPEMFIKGIYNYSNEGVCSWYDLAIEIINIANINCIINPIETKDYPTPAIRPPYSVLNKEKIRTTFGLTIPYWKDSLKVCIGKISRQ